MRKPTKTLLVTLALIVLLGYFVDMFPKMQKGMDFVDFYSGARLVVDGSGAQLYNPELQAHYQLRYSGRTGTYYIHPPFETLIYLPFALESPWLGYALWSGFNVALLVVTVWQMGKHLAGLWACDLLLLVSLLFVPLLLDLLQGQDSVELLFLLVSTFIMWRQQSDFEAGCLLGLGLFKFHIVLPVAILLWLSSSGKFLRGFGLILLLLFFVCIGICGWHGLLIYPAFLRQLSALPLAGIHPRAMANLRGLFGVAFARSGTSALILTVLASFGIFALAARQIWMGRSQRREGLIFAYAVLVALLVSYHLSPHDLTILLLPFALIAQHLITVSNVSRPTIILFAIVCLILWLPPFHLVLLRYHSYSYVCYVVLGLFALTHLEIERRGAHLEFPTGRSHTA